MPLLNHNPEKSIPNQVAGAFAGWTVCTIITPIETIKAKLQMQTSDPRTKLFTGPIDCAKKIIQHGGIKSLYHALPATLLFRTSFAVMFSSYQSINNFLRDYSSNHPDSIFAFSQPVAQFLSGGISAELFWLVALPFDIVKNRIMCDSFTKPRYPTWRSAAQAVWIESGPQVSLGPGLTRSNYCLRLIVSRLIPFTVIRLNFPRWDS